MPAGNPAGYLPQIKKRLKKAGATPYKARRARSTGGVKAPVSGRTVTPLPRPIDPKPGQGSGKPVATIKVPGSVGYANPKKPNKAPRRFGPAAQESSVTSAQYKARGKKLGDLKPRFSSTKGKRRLSFADAYLRRSNESSRARVEKLYGKTAGGKLRRQAEGGKVRRYLGRSK